MNRREFIKNSAAAAVGFGLSGSFLPAAGKFVKTPAAAVADRVLLIINLFGGNDGLNTVIPLNQYDRYRQLRPTTGVDRAGVLPLPGVPDLGLHPRMNGLLDLYGKGKVAIINGVGVPQNASGLFDHAAGQYQFQSCDLAYAVSNRPPSGWLGRYLDTVPERFVSPGIDMGGGKLILTGNRREPISISSLDEFKLKFSFDEKERSNSYKNLMKVAYRENEVAENNRQLRLKSLAQSSVIQARTAGYTPAAQYPAESYLGFQMMQSAQLIWGDLGVKALTVGFGDFDTHYGQVGVHDKLLQELSDSIFAFYADLQAHGLSDRVLILTISEFGRRAYENNVVGTDHGFASVAFAIGDTVKGGVYGGYPNLNETSLVLDGNPDVNTDFRAVYTTAISRFLDADPGPAVGGKFPVLGFL